MAFADLILGAVCLPHQFIYITGDHFQLWTAYLSSNLYFDTLQFTLVQASLLSAVISAERLNAVNWPPKHRTLSTQTYRVVIFVVWTLVILMGMIVHFSVGHAFCLQISFYLILILIECSCNMGIWRTFQRKSIPSQQQNRVSQNQRLTKTLLLVSSVVLLPWLPLTICFLLTRVIELSMPFHLFPDGCLSMLFQLVFQSSRVCIKDSWV